MKILNLILLLFLSQLCLAQVPSLSVFKEKGNEQLQISQLDVNIEVVGNIATTTFDIVFYNPYSRVLEGELSMDLKNGQEICRYALDINGKLREGVIVEKIKARQAFEAVVNQKIDPGIINITKGNSFNTKIYPIPAKGTKRVVLALSETLNGDHENLYYTLPFGGNLEIAKFSLNVKVIKNKSEVKELKSEFQNIDFDNKDDAYMLSFKKDNFKTKKPLKFTIPRFSKESHQLFTCEFEGETYFYLNLKPDALKQFKREEPKNIAIYWDNSHSANKRDIAKEIEFLKAYLNTFKTTVNVTVNSFNYSTAKAVQFTTTDIADIINYIKTLQNDGATWLNNIEFTNKVDEILLFSDGVSTIGKAEISATIPVFTITSSYGSDYSLLKYIADKTNGEFIDLKTVSTQRAIELLTMDEEKFLSCKFNPAQIKEVYPKLPKRINDYLEVVGILKTDKAKIEINFGDKKGINKTKTFVIRKKTNSSTVSRIWATKKIAFLNANYEDNKDAILKLSQKHKIITKNTSMLVLDRIQDYVRYKIVPPVEMQKEYYRLLALTNNSKKTSLEIIEARNIAKLNSLIYWYTIKQREAKEREAKAAQAREARIIATKAREANAAQAREARIIATKAREANAAKVKEAMIAAKKIILYDSIPIRNAQKLIKGILIDEFGEGIPFANVVIIDNKDVHTGSIIASGIADFEGKYSISISSNKSLTMVISCLGYKKRTIDISKGYPSTIILKMNAEMIEGVQIKSYVVPLIDMDQTSTGGTFTSQEIARMPGRSAESVAVTVGGVSSDNNGNTGGMRGQRSGSNSSIKVLAWMPDAPYIEELKKVSDKELLPTYYKLKAKNINRPSFYIQVADLFFAKGMHDEAVRILSNTIELDLENPELLKVVARRLLDEGEYEASIKLFIEVKDLRPEEPQSYRDLALAYSQSKKYQKALEAYLHILNNEWGRFEDVKKVVLNDFNALIALHKQDLDLSEVNKGYIESMPLDIRVTIDWSTNNNDIDLWVVDPNGEKCYYSNKNTKIGGKISRDFTRGYGPEEFSLKTAKRGYYTVYVNYFSESRQSITGPVTVYVELTTHFGTAQQQTERIAIQLENGNDKKTIQIGQLEFNE